ncbi:arabinofuranosidase catalytic domain-containing protein [Micromonospora sp. DT201]|uniref:arabinofuranosidase catalytic domain-containing protein n=1 Tax=Micromonospora sp. DT201 TaxID=3393442 RepID=UPI003CEC7BD7
MFRPPTARARHRRLATRAAIALSLVGTSLALALPAQANEPAAPARPQGPCDIYAAGSTPCVTAHSTTRALSASYNGPLYQVLRTSDRAVKDVGIVAPSAGPVPDAGGYADAAAQDAFCASTLCLITVVYDQSGKGNHLYQAPPGTFRGQEVGGYNTLSIADMAPVTVSGHKAYGVYIMPGMGYRNNDASYLAKDDEPQGIYMVFDGTHFDSGCCFNYGNTSTNSRAVGTGTMDTVYFGTATAWGKGRGPGPWIMSDMEAGLFSGYNAGVNEADPTIDSWRFVTGSVNGGGGNQWDLRGGNAQDGALSTFYSGPRPGSLTNSTYFPMHRRGAVQLGNGGDNGNGSAGTFYEGVMTAGYPTDASVQAVQANIVAAKYEVQRLSLSRATTFTPGSTQSVTETFTNTTGSRATDVELNLATPNGWKALVSGTSNTSATFSAVEPGASVQATFTVTAPTTIGAGYLSGKAVWTSPTLGGGQSTSIAQAVRNVLPVKINEVRFRTSSNATDQFIELYNPTGVGIDISNWTLTNTPGQSAATLLATIPASTTLAAGGTYLLGLSGSGLAAPANPGATTINVRSTTGFAVGQQIDIDTGSGRETRVVQALGTAATAPTTLFVPVTTGPWLTIPAGSTNVPVTSAAGFEVGQKIAIDSATNYELATVTEVGKAATQTTLSAVAAAGASNIKVAANANMTVGDKLTIDAGEYKEVVTVAEIGTTGVNGTGVTLTTPLQFNHRSAVDVSDRGTGISFSPATSRAHSSGVSVQALGSGITLDTAVNTGHPLGTAIVDPQVTTAGYQGSPSPDQWFGGALSVSAGSIALRDATGAVVVDAMVYGSQQSSSSGNGTITSPELATMEADQGGGGCIVVVAGAAAGPGRSNTRAPDGKDADSLCRDFVTSTAPSPGVARPVVTATAAPVNWGTAATVTVTVSAGGKPALGTVELREGDTARGTATLSANRATFTLPAGLAAGSHELTALYSGSDTLSAAQGTVTLTVNLPPAWTATKIYNTGDKVSLDGKVYLASWWTQNQKPGDPNGPWQELALTEDGRTIWTASRIFNAGDQVSYDGHSYEGKWWTRNQAPGDPYGPWKLLS